MEKTIVITERKRVIAASEVWVKSVIATSEDGVKHFIGEAKDGVLYIADSSIYAPNIPLSPHELRLIADMLEQK